MPPTFDIFDEDTWPDFPGCKHCGRPICGRRPNARYCSVQCRLAAQMERRRQRNKEGRSARKRQLRCMECEELFLATRADAQFCSAKCRKRWERSLAGAFARAMKPRPRVPGPRL